MPSFSSDVLQRIQAAQRVLLSPLDYGDRTTWCHAVATRIQAVMGSDCVYVIQGSGPASTTLGSPHLDSDFARETEPYLQSLDSGEVPMPVRLQLERIRRGSGAYHELHLADRPTIERSPYYQDIARARGLRYATGMSAIQGGGEVTFCALFRRRDAPGYEVKATQRLATLVPALEAGLHHQRRLAHLRERLRSLVDTLDDAVAVFSVDGREEHRNPALVTLLRDEPEGASLMRAASLLVLDVLDARGATGVEPVPAERTVDLSSGRYDLRATWAGQLLDGGPTVFVTVTRASPFPPPQALRRRWGLTAREAEVAVHVARGATNSAIADALTISTHTARHHVSSVLDKLDVASRKEVAAALVRSG